MESNANRASVVFLGSLGLAACLALGALGCSASSELGDDASGGGTMGAGGAVHPTSGDPSGRMRVFVTATGYTGDLKTQGGGSSGLDGADKICNLSASAAGLGGRWVAWLSDSKTAAPDRVQDVGPWYLVDRKTLVFPSKAALALSPLAAITRNERGVLTQAGVWTGTSGGAAGAVPATTPVENTCSDWTTGESSTEGLMGGTNVSQWTQNITVPCFYVNELYCFEQPPAP
jgi:hypothetical protein